MNAREKLEAIAIGRARGVRPSSPRQYVPIRVIWTGERWRRIYKWGGGRTLDDAARYADRKAQDLGLPVLGMIERQTTHDNLPEPRHD